MPRAYSVDLREKVLQHIEKHHDKTDIPRPLNKFF